MSQFHFAPTDISVDIIYKKCDKTYNHGNISYIGYTCKYQQHYQYDIICGISYSTDDGSVHTDVEYIEETYSNCTEHGYTYGVYCNECEKIILGYEIKELDEGYHIDDDWNGICDLCGKDNLWNKDECEHICHSDHWFFNMVWGIANFFHSIFGISPECECGEAHY